ncbi:MAG TPA: HlyD family efflux transporter periplasmic adaptor subunit [Arenibaculum sp.]|nr:HlyD family efflux transporter periplasmic adaptor subunit [Arenibaculum sp.]
MNWFQDIAATALAAIGIISSQPPATVLQGYVEGDFLYVAAPDAGRLARLPVSRGDRIDAGSPLFALDLTRAQAERERAAAMLERARAELADLTKGRRPEELRVIAERNAEAEAALDYAEARLRRLETLVRRDVASAEQLDEARSQRLRARARVAELEAEADVARLPARTDRIEAAEHAIGAARAELVQAEHRLAELAPAAPRPALVERTFYEPGEWVPAGTPVVSLLPPDSVKLRFFVPEPLLSGIGVGDKVKVGCDGCPAGMNAHITYISPKAEYTPPVIYSVGRREKLVYLVEARPAGGMTLNPGQPVDVELAR